MAWFGMSGRPVRRLPREGLTVRIVQLLSLVAVVTTLPLTGCELIDKIPPPTSANQPVYSGGNDAWKRSAVWLYATEGATGGQEGECRRMFELLEGELSCKGAMCKTGAELATEWLDKCSELAAGQAEAIRGTEQTLRKRATEPPSPCSAEYDDLLSSGCKPETCREKAQAWATSCGDHEAGALTGTILQKRVARRVGGDSLDLRGCASIEKALVDGAKCANETECREALPHVEAYAARCQGEGRRPDVTTAVAQLAITAGANREAKPIAVAADVKPLARDAVPLVLADGSGAILSLCHQRPVDLKGFLALQERCVGNPLTIARLFYGKSGDPSVQVGELPAPAGLDPPSPYPWLEIHGERDRYAKRKAASLGAALGALGGSGAAEIGKLITLIGEYAPWLDGAPEVQQALQSADSKLAPLFAAAADTKVKGSKLVFEPADVRGFIERSNTHPLADLTPAGSFALGAVTQAYWLETASLLPQSTAAYRKRLAPLEQRLRVTRTLLPGAVAVARAKGTSHAKACAAAQSKEQSIEQKLNGCVFTSCNEGEVEALVTAWHEARALAQRERIAADVALGPTGSGTEREGRISNQGCEKLSW